jgi:hypothetical protein
MMLGLNGGSSSFTMFSSPSGGVRLVEAAPASSDVATSRGCIPYMHGRGAAALTVVEEAVHNDSGKNGPPRAYDLLQMKMFFDWGRFSGRSISPFHHPDK